MIKIIFLNFLLVLTLQSLSFGNNYVLSLENNLLKNVSLLNPDKTFNAIIEIPSGSTEKWEINPEGNVLQREFKDGKPRNINYIGYPGNYGFFPQTLLDIKDVGDSDAIDVLIIGKRLNKGSVIRVKILGMLSMKDDGLTDNKVIAVLENSKFSKEIKDLNEFEESYPGILQIIETWFKNYKGYKLEVTGFIEKNLTIQFILNSHKNYLKNEK
tara:strand:- start:114 stop:752 length:639 start_codon:yes stop_codon:yes gene_type:complete